MSENTSAISNHERQLILFALGKGNYGIPIENVFEIKKMGEITVVPKAPKYIEGVINLRGNVIPVIDLRKRFGMEKIEEEKYNLSKIIKENIELLKFQKPVAYQITVSRRDL